MCQIERKLSVHELGFLDLQTPERPQIVSGVAFLSGPVPADEIEARLADFIAENPQYRCRITSGDEPQWEEASDFQLHRHCIETELSVATREDIVSYIAGFAARRTLDLPPWQVIIIRAYVGSAQQPVFALAIWAHHSLLDGLEGMKLFSSLVDQTSVNKRSSVDDAVGEEPKAPLTSAPCVAAMAKSVTRGRRRGPLTTDAGSNRRTTLAFQWPRKVFKAARQKYKATFQETLLSVLASGLGKYCNKRKRQRSLRTVLPLGRAAKGKETFTSNSHDVGFIELPGTLKCQLSHLQKIRKGLSALRKEQVASVFPSIIRFLGALPGALRTFVANRWSRQADVLISLIPGGPRGRRIASAQVTSVYAQPALPPGHGAVIGVLVTPQDVCVTVQVDPSVIDDIEDLRHELQYAYEALK